METSEIPKGAARKTIALYDNKTRSTSIQFDNKANRCERSPLIIGFPSETRRRNELLTPSWLFLSISSSTSFSNQSCHRYSTLRYHPRLQITTQLYQQFPRQSHNPDPPNPAAPMTKTLFIPLRQLALWLIPQPIPCDLDRHRPDVAITRLTHPLFSGHLSALMRRWGQSRQCPHFFAIPELPPTEACPGRTIQGTPSHIARRCSTQSLSTLIAFLKKNFKVIVYCIQY